MVDPREEFVARIDLSKSRVRAFEGFVFLCGGPRAKDPVPIISIRHMIYHELTSGRHGDIVGRLKTAEDIQDWFRDGNYRDLLTFEEHLAGLSAVIVLVVESPGAIAELGVFSVSQAFSDRLLVLVAELHYAAESFIRLGPLQRLENASEKSVLVYDWHDISISGKASERFDKVAGEMAGIVAAIKDFISPSDSERIFKLGEPAHTMFLICELCDLFGALNQTEVHDYLRALGIELDAEDVLRYTFLLQKCDLLGMKPKGHGRYFHAINWSSRISFGFIPGRAMDRDRVRVEVAQFYEKEIKTRSEVIKKIGRGVG